ncbi:hypothetical protein [Arthrobacter castelli]|nr:hypothetical protein [Arthrobacter castelli]
MSASELLTGDSWHTDLFDIPAYLAALNVEPAPRVSVSSSGSIGPMSTR